MNNATTITLKLMLCVLISTQSINVLAQSIRYSGFYDWENGAEILKDAVALANGSLLVIGNTSESNGACCGKSYNIVVDSTGELEYAFVREGIDLNIIPKAVVKTSSGSVYEAGYLCDYSVESPGYCDYYFSKLTNEGDTVFTKVINRPDTGDFVLDLVETRPNKLMLIGWTYDDTTSTDADLMFITVDTLGNELNRVVWGGVEPTTCIRGSLLMKMVMY